MKRELWKIELNCGFDCVPNLSVGRSQYEVTDAGRVLDGKKTESLSVPIGERRISIADAADSPKVAVVCYSDEKDCENLVGVIEKMYEEFIRTMHWLVRIFNERSEGLRIPDKKEILERISAKDESSSKTESLERSWIDREDFVYMLRQKICNKVESFFASEGKTVPNDWGDFFNESYNEDVVSYQIDMAKAIAKSDDKVGFKSRNELDEILETLSEMTARDLLTIYNSSERVSSTKP